MRKHLSILLTLCLMAALCLPVAAMAEVASDLPVTGLEGLRFSEVLASNQGSYLTTYETSPDWIELENTTDADMDLSGVWLTDSKKVLNKFVFAEGTILKAHSFLLVFASGMDGVIGGDLHAAFKLSADGESVALYKDGVRVDKLDFGGQSADIAYAVGADGLFQYTTTPTPGEPNVITEPAR